MTPPQETETHDVALSRIERWIVHHVLTDRADDLLDDGESPPDWLVDAFETVEAGGETFTRVQLRNLVDALDAFAGDEGVAEEDATVAMAIADRFETELQLA